MRTALLIVALALASVGCGRLEEHVRHADAAYRASRYEDAEEWLERVELEVGDLAPDARSRFYFVRGMSAFRLGHRDEAFHYLALCRENSQLPESAIPPEDTEVMTRALAELTPDILTHHAAPAPANADGTASAPAAP